MQLNSLRQEVIHIMLRDIAAIDGCLHCFDVRIAAVVRSTRVVLVVKDQLL